MLTADCDTAGCVFEFGTDLALEDSAAESLNAEYDDPDDEDNYDADDDGGPCGGL